WSETKNLTFFEKYSIMVAVFIYVLSTVVLFYVNMHTERLYFKDLAARDPMTGLLNRRGMQAVWRNKMTKKNVALAVFDIDSFKTINDTYGHDVGDSAIQLVAKCIRDNIRHSDVASRFGGEEFTVLLPHTNQEQACYFAERLRKRIEQEIVKVEDFLINYTISIGVCEYKPYFESHTQWLKSADAALYRAKENGRNQTCLHECD
ncbi:GGDEF domain-containing protein, partial [Vibrio sp. 2089]|uniref:GGDEF domain-containing protein n=1 Tax=Vibrio sp. 2089 TaxID=3074591 RepID=UPI002963F01F